MSHFVRQTTLFEISHRFLVLCKHILITSLSIRLLSSSIIHTSLLISFRILKERSLLNLSIFPTAAFYFNAQQQSTNVIGAICYLQIRGETQVANSFLVLEGKGRSSQLELCEQRLRLGQDSSHCLYGCSLISAANLFPYEILFNSTLYQMLILC